MIRKITLTFLLCYSALGTDLSFCYEFNDYYPFTNKKNKINGPGIIIEIINEAAKKSGLNVVAYRSSWKRCKEDLRNGRADITAAMIWTKKRSEWAVFPMKNGTVDTDKFLWKARYMIHTGSSSRVQWDGAKLGPSGVKISAPEGYVAYKLLDDIGVLPNEKFKAAQAMKLVSINRLDGFVIDELIGRNLLKNLGLEKSVTTLDKPFLETLWYAALSRKFKKQSPEKAISFHNQIEIVRKEMKEALVKKYISN